jgi:hypothetical protein
MRKLLLAILVIVVGLALATGQALAQERFGGLTGMVTDESGGVLPGTTVNITNKVTGQVRSVVTGSDGRYAILDLDPGRYSVRIELTGFTSVQADDINVLLGRTLDFNAQLKVGNLAETVTVTAEATPVIDLRTTTIAHNVTAEEFDRLPKARSFQSIALTAPSVNSGEIEGGFQVNGASGAENAFTVDGVVTNSLVNGASRQNTVFEYLQEVQVKTTGIPAEYGGALGGVISAVTKSGGNAFRGEAHYFYDGSGLSAGPVERLVLNPADDLTVRYVQDDKQPDHRNEFGGSIGGPIIRDRLFFFGAYSPKVANRTNSYLFSNGTDPGEIARKITSQQAFGKVTFSNSRLTAHGSVLWTPTTAEGTLPAYNGFAPNVISSSEAGNAVNLGRGYESDQTNLSGSVDMTMTNASFLTFRGGYFYDNYKDTGIPNITSYTYQSTNIGQPGVPLNLQGPVGTQNTPRAQIAFFDTTKRGFFNIDYNHAFTAGGIHTLKGGFGYQRTINDVDSSYPGGYVFLWWGRSFQSTATGATDTGTYGYYEVNDFGTRGKVGANIISLYIQDQWTVGSRLTLNLGVRTENEVIPSFAPDIKKDAIKFNMADKLAPRVGAAYDIRGDGKFKLFGSWGRYFDWTKYELSRGSFGGDLWHVFYRSLDTLDIGNLNLSNMPGRDIWDPSPTNEFQDFRVPAIENIDPNIKPMYQDSTSVGLEYQMRSNMVLTVNYTHNILRRTIEDMAGVQDGSEIYVIGNPGEGLGTFQFPTGATPIGIPNPKAKRQYDAIEFGVSRRFMNNWFASANYVYSRLYGNYAGLASSDEIRTPTTTVGSAVSQQQAASVSRQGGNANRAWDLDELLWDSHGNLDVIGRLATDRPHVVKLYGGYLMPFGTSIGAFFYGGSGTPLTTYVQTNHRIPAMVEGRGDMGRTDMLSKTDLLLSHDVSFQGNRKLRFEFNVLNVFNQKTSRHRFNYLNRGNGIHRASSAINITSVNLQNGYDYNARIRATSDGANAFDPRYNLDDLFEPGTQGQFTVKFLF